MYVYSTQGFPGVRSQKSLVNLPNYDKDKKITQVPHQVMCRCSIHERWPFARHHVISYDMQIGVYLGNNGNFRSFLNYQSYHVGTYVLD